ncbi:hypothetical protein GCM10027169_00180 [Gordonia jinhuaensis]|uniref:Uncharacterized protein n=1 Tax=Gordonia jinhuaensis TaxID=1517702 RepID=A0A916WPR8_9ACTN|nr:hypothetical protein [Gordonia jinhuaensis]GGB18205.1 hypothetical protein GCM10011489_02840 [Gordonia jinhuaensis]
MTSSDDRREALRRRQAAVEDARADLADADEHRAAQRERRDRTRAQVAQGIGSLTSEAPLVGIPAGLIAAFLMRERSADGTSLADAYEARLQRRGRRGGLAALGGPDGKVTQSEGEEMRHFLLRTTTDQGIPAYVAWEQSPEATQASHDSLASMLGESCTRPSLPSHLKVAGVDDAAPQQDSSPRRPPPGGPSYG